MARFANAIAAVKGAIVASTSSDPSLARVVARKSPILPSPARTPSQAEAGASHVRAMVLSRFVASIVMDRGADRDPILRNFDVRGRESAYKAHVYVVYGTP